MVRQKRKIKYNKYFDTICPVFLIFLFIIIEYLRFLNDLFRCLRLVFRLNLAPKKRHGCLKPLLPPPLFLSESETNVTNLRLLTNAFLSIYPEFIFSMGISEERLKPL